MENIVVKKDQLLAALKKNRAEHRKIFEEAIDGFRKTLTAELERRLDGLKKGQRVDVRISLSEPKDQTMDYDRAIRMVEMSIVDTVELSEDDFARYVMDDWGWQRNFLSSNSAYSASATSKLSSFS